LEQESEQAALEVVQPEIGPGSRLVDMRAAATPATAPYDGLSKQLLRQPLRRRSLFVTSAQTGDGTTTIAANLAAALSRQAQSVLLVELRLTAPHLLHLLGDPAAVEGFEDGLRGEVPLSDCIFRVASSSLTVIAAKRAMTEQEALAQSGSLNDFLEWAESRFDWLVLDCPSVSSSAWTRWFELNADPVLLVVRAGVTRQGAVKRVARQLKDRLAAAILNDSTAA
jgi:Mrp family chromosome partitioning ATPase